jgi:N-acetylglucosamine repressor
VGRGLLHPENFITLKFRDLVVFLSEITYNNFVSTLNLQSYFFPTFFAIIGMTTQKATHQQTKQHNRDLVLKTIFDHDTISRADIARATNLTRTTVSDVVTVLLNEGLVEEVGFGLSRGGKSPILLSIAADSRFLVGLSLGKDKFIGAVVNLRGEIKDTVEFPVKDSDGEQALQLVYQILDQLIKKRKKSIAGIGIGTPGLINTREGIVLTSVNLDWQDLPLAQLVQKRYGLHVSILNDSQATAIGEYVYGGNHKEYKNMIVVNAKHGIGAGILINGRLFQGDGGGAGEIGHVVVEKNGALCRCGKRGCLETIVSVRAVIERLQTFAREGATTSLPKNPRSITLDAIETAFKSGDALTRKVVLNAGHHLGMALANLIGALNIQKIVLTGDMTRFGTEWFDAVQKAMQETALTRMAQDTKLEIGTLDFKACVLGASALPTLDGYSLLFNRSSDS